MSNAPSDPKVDSFVNRAGRWQAEMRALRSILLACGLDEVLRWGKPCYQVDGRNLAIIQPFERYCALMFFRGDRLDDPRGLLRSPGPSSRTARRLEFTGTRDIVESVVRSFVEQAVALERADAAPAPPPAAEPEHPEELDRILAADRKLALAFRALTPGRRRGYLLHFAAARRPETRTARIRRCTPRILAGKGLHDR